MRVLLLLSFCFLGLVACSSERQPAEGWAVEGEIPFDGKLVISQ